MAEKLGRVGTDRDSETVRTLRRHLEARNGVPGLEGTPDLSEELRPIPSAEFLALWFREPQRRCVPRDVFDGLSDHGRRLCRDLVVDSAERLETGYHDDLGGSPF